MIARVELKFEPRDLWIGCYWNYTRVRLLQAVTPLTVDRAALVLYFCLVPMLVIKVTLCW